MYRRITTLPTGRDSNAGPWQGKNYLCYIYAGGGSANNVEDRMGDKEFQSCLTVVMRKQKGRSNLLIFNGVHLVQSILVLFFSLFPFKQSIKTLIIWYSLREKLLKLIVFLYKTLQNSVRMHVYPRSVLSW